MCGVFGVTNSRDASKLIYLGLFALQHRGQESAGMSLVSPADSTGIGNPSSIQTHKDFGLVCDVFPESRLQELKGTAGIGHVRYSTAGGNRAANVQPLSAQLTGQPVAISHNGNLVNDSALRRQLEAQGALFQGTADTELILHTMAHSSQTLMEEKVFDSLKMARGAFSLLVLTPTHLLAAVDPCGYRPLVLGKMDRSDGDAPSFVVCSETCALDLVGAQFVRDLVPGEFLSIECATGKVTSRLLPSLEGSQGTQIQSRCSFEHIYFARPDSHIWGQNVLEVRRQIGLALAAQSPVDADAVMAVPDSGIPMAMGYAQGSGLPFQIGFIRNHYVGRTFIEPTQSIRNFRVRLKLNPVRSLVQGKRLVVIDDSIVRGTTSRKIVELLREAGAKEIHLRIGSPMVKFPCFYGIDTPKRKELLAQKMDLLEMKEFLKVDSLDFLHQDQLIQVMRQTLPVPPAAARTHPKAGWCVSCFDGIYQDLEAQTQIELDI